MNLLLSGTNLCFEKICNLQKYFKALDKSGEMAYNKDDELVRRRYP